LDCKDGTNGRAFCISVGKLKLEKAEIKKRIGVEIDPIKRLLVFHSKSRWSNEIAQLKKIKDSYKLLKGK
jgi:hypothetical protein